MNFLEHHYQELYLRKNDPHETLNLAKAPGYNTVIEILSAEFAQRQDEISKPALP
jgi:hypothetical protein